MTKTTVKERVTITGGTRINGQRRGGGKEGRMYAGRGEGEEGV